MPQLLEKITSSVLALAAAVLSTTLVHREFFPDRANAAVQFTTAEFVKEWTDIPTVGRELAKPNGSIKIVEFSDLECPFCRRFHTTLDRVIAANGSDISVSFVHFPLPSHRFARPAARALECAVRQSRASAMVDAIFAGQDSLGLKAWSRFAMDAHVPDTSAFTRCLSERADPPAIASGLAMGKRFDVRGTPTVIINGWRYAAPPSESTLVADLRDFRAGRVPGSARSQ